MAKRPSKPKSADLSHTVIETAMKLAVERGWRDLSLVEIAAEAKAPLADVYPLFPSKQAILAAFSRSIDRAVLAGEQKDSLEGPAPDRLFDVLMRRFDALQPYREAIAAIAADQGRDPVALLCSAAQLRRSMACMLEAANLASDSSKGAIRVNGLIAIYLATLRVWLRDEAEDMAKTMAALDRNLRRTDNLLGRLRVRRRTAAA